MADRELHGRTVIYTDAEEITSQNVLDVLKSADEDNASNVADIEYLYKY